MFVNFFKFFRFTVQYVGNVVTVVSVRATFSTTSEGRHKQRSFCAREIPLTPALPPVVTGEGSNTFVPMNSIFDVRRERVTIWKNIL